MSIDQLQDFFLAKITESPLSAASIIVDDGFYSPRHPQREEGLRSRGLVLVILPPYSNGLLDQTQNGAGLEEVEMVVRIEENPIINRSTGTKMKAFAALLLLRHALIGQVVVDRFDSRVVLADPPFVNLGVQDGAFAVVSIFKVKLPTR